MWLKAGASTLIAALPIAVSFAIDSGALSFQGSSPGERLDAKLALRTVRVAISAQTATVDHYKIVVWFQHQQWVVPYA